MQHTNRRQCLCSFHPQLFTILKLTKARQRMCSAFSPPSRLVPLLVRAVCQGAELQSSDGSAASLPTISVQLGGTAPAAPAFASLLDASSVASCFCKQTRYFA